MPAPGDQHRDTPASANPFIEKGHYITPYTAKEIATLQSRLEKQLGPEYISTRPGNGGGKVHYLAAEKAINLANEVFGFNGWSSSIQNVQIDFVDENPQSGRVSLGLSTIVRVTLRDGSYHEDTGYGHCENAKGKAPAFEKAKKEAATDAMKRALRNFGNVLGNCLYDKDYLIKIAKVKVEPSRWAAENLHRHPDYAPIKREPVPPEDLRQSKGSAIQRNTSVQSNHSAASVGSTEFEDDFGGNLFDETDFSHPDEVRLDNTISNGSTSPVKPAAGYQQNVQRQNVARTNPMPQMRPPNIQPPPQIQGVQAPQKPQAATRPSFNAGQPAAKMLPPQTPGHHQIPPQTLNGATNALTHQNRDGSTSNSSSGTTTETSSHQASARQPSNSNDQLPQSRPHETDDQDFLIPRPLPQGAPEGFITGRSEVLKQPPEVRQLSANNMAFNPHADSPSIRRTHGMNHGTSAPIRKTEAQGGVGSAQSPMQQPGPGGFQNTGGKGMGGAHRPGGTNYFVNPAADMNRRIGMPTGQGGVQSRPGGYRPPTVVKRPAMTDVTNTYGAENGPDLKKIKGDAGAPVQGGNGKITEQNGVT